MGGGGEGGEEVCIFKGVLIWHHHLRGGCLFVTGHLLEHGHLFKETQYLNFFRPLRVPTWNLNHKVFGLLISLKMHCKPHLALV